jgi:hypothetical protein
MLYILLLIIPILIYAILSFTILFHLKKYGIAGDVTRQINILFFIISFFLISMTVWTYFGVPWDQLDLAGMVQNFFNSNPILYPQQ